MPYSYRTLFRASMVAVLAALCIARPTSAAPITWVFAGPVDFTSGEWVDPLPLGSQASLSITWEPDTPNDPDCPPGSGRYNAIKGATLSILGHSLAYGGGAVEVSAPDGNCNPVFGDVAFHMFLRPFPNGTFPNVPGLPNGTFSDEIVAFVFPADPTAPDLASILADVDRAAIFVQSTFGAGGFTFNGPLQAAPVPEPGSLILLATGLIAAGKVARRRRQQQEIRRSGENIH